MTRRHEDISQENIQPVLLLGRRLVLVPQSTGTQRSVQDRCDSSEDGVSRRHVEVRSHMEGRLCSTKANSTQANSTLARSTLARCDSGQIFVFQISAIFWGCCCCCVVVVVCRVLCVVLCCPN